MAVSNNDDWRSNWNGIVSMLEEARKEARFTDVQFVVGDETSKHEFHAHKAILACGSPVFEKMFYGALAEKRSVIETDDDHEAFEMLLNYIYGKTNKVISLTSAWKFFMIGDKYLVPKTEDAAKVYIKSVSLTEDAFWDLIQKDETFSNPLFLLKINSYIFENTKGLIYSDNFLNAPEIFIDTLLQMNNLNVLECKLLLAVTKWGYENEQANSKDLLKFYKHIRFSSITIDQFLSFIDSYPKAIDAQSSLKILQHLRYPVRHNLPEWCSTSKRSRRNPEASEEDNSIANDDWRSEWNGIVSVLDKARKEDRFTDIQFSMGDGTSRKEFRAHKAILACGSPVFEKMFYGELAEKRSVIETDDEPEAFEMLLNYIYGKRNYVISLTSAWKFFTIGAKYLVPKTEDAAKVYIKSISLTKEDFWDLIQKDETFSNPLFLQKINSYIIENAENLIYSGKFFNAPEIFLDTLLHINTLNVDEYELLSAVTKWAFINEKGNSKDLLKFYKHIKFSSLTSDEFFRFIDSYPKAIDAQSSLEILQHLRDPFLHNLPEWCSKSKESIEEIRERHKKKIYANDLYRGIEEY